MPKDVTKSWKSLVKAQLAQRGVGIHWNDGVPTIIDLPGGGNGLPRKLRPIKVTFGTKPPGSAGRGDGAGYQLQKPKRKCTSFSDEALHMSDADYHLVYKDAKTVLQRTGPIDMDLSYSKQPFGAIDLAIKKLCSVHHEFQQFSGHNYWPIRGYFMKILRTSSGAANAASKAGEAANSGEATSEDDLDSKPTKKKGKAKKGEAAVPAAEPVATGQQAFSDEPAPENKTDEPIGETELGVEPEGEPSTGALQDANDGEVNDGEVIDLNVSLGDMTMGSILNFTNSTIDPNRTGNMSVFKDDEEDGGEFDIREVAEKPSAPALPSDIQAPTASTSAGAHKPAPGTAAPKLTGTTAPKPTHVTIPTPTGSTTPTPADSTTLAPTGTITSKSAGTTTSKAADATAKPTSATTRKLAGGTAVAKPTSGTIAPTPASNPTNPKTVSKAPAPKVAPKSRAAKSQASESQAPGVTAPDNAGATAPDPDSASSEASRPVSPAPPPSPPASRSLRKRDAQEAPPPAAPVKAPRGSDPEIQPSLPTRTATTPFVATKGPSLLGPVIRWRGIDIVPEEMTKFRSLAERQAKGTVPARVAAKYRELVNKLADDPTYDPASEPDPLPKAPRGRPRKNPVPAATPDSTAASAPKPPNEPKKGPKTKPKMKPIPELTPEPDSELETTTTGADKGKGKGLDEDEEAAMNADANVNMNANANAKKSAKKSAKQGTDSTIPATASRRSNRNK
ncbi:hypothetical protein FRC09_020711 [Ceratobasidium sp. 395]|nr:hypothetical protein FRC09_020711 [Ceratobasidium sp. 395]